jgi:NAD(P)-dependent dehydrogenase (short-subunit alcohol dehydrogenase family)
MKRLEGKVIVITGGTKGVGRTMAEACAKEGAKVVIGGRDENSALRSVRLMRTFGSDGLFVKTELTKIDDIRNLFKAAHEKFGHIDGLFCYAGVTPVSPLDTCDEATFDLVTAVNYKAGFFCCQEAIKYMRLNGGRGGSIVLTGSPHAWGGDKDRAAYAMTKGVLRVLMSHIAHHYANEHIRCNYMTLGWTPTEGEVALRMSQGQTEAELREEAGKIIPMGRMCERTDYVESIILMLSDASSMMTGSVFRVSGGHYI